MSVVLLLGSNASAQQHSRGDCSPNINGVGGNLVINCPNTGRPNYGSKIEESKAQEEYANYVENYKARHKGCMPGTIPSCHSVYSSGAGGEQFLGNLGCQCVPLQ